MEKASTLVWILLAIGAFVLWMVKKMQETTAQERRERPARPGPAVPALPTAKFQEMLKQMQARNTMPAAAASDPPAPLATPAPVPAGPLTMGGRPMPRETARAARSLERPVRVRPSLEAPATARLRHAPAPPVRRADTLPRASAEAPITDHWQKEPAVRAVPLGNTVRQLLREPASLRAAFILSEIFRRPT